MCFAFSILIGEKSFSQPKAPIPSETKSQVQPEAPSQAESQAQGEALSEAVKTLKKLLENYQADSLIIPVKQDIFLSLLKTNLTSEGNLFLKGEKFRLDLKGRPSSFSLFDGSVFWYQPDLNEKLVFQMDKPSEIQKMSSLFEINSLLEVFELSHFSARKLSNRYHFRLRKKRQGLKELVIKSDKSFIVEMRLIWEDLNTWQKYSFSKPVIKNLPDSYFIWSKKDHRVLRATDF